MTTYWTIRLLDGEEIFLNSNEAYCYPTEQYVTIQTHLTRFGAYDSERCIPWHQVKSYARDNEDD